MKDEKIITNKMNSELENDKEMVNAIFSNEKVNDKNAIILNEGKDLPENYFDQFPNQLLKNIEQTTQIEPVSKNKIIQIIRMGKYAVAAAVLLIIASTIYLIKPKNLLLLGQEKEQVETISLQEISTEEIESYVDNYELMNEADLQVEINKIVTAFGSNKISNDSAN